jgi:putative transposase
MPDILPLLLRLQPVLSKTQCRQLTRLVMAMLAMTGRITQLGLSRWAGEGGSYRTVQRFFHTPIDWLEVKWLFFQLFLCRDEDTYLLVGDETVLGKAGKQTYGLDRFYSSLFGKPIPGLAFFVFSLVSVQNRQAYPLLAQQVVRTKEEQEQAAQRRKKTKAAKKTKTQKKPAGRPQGSKNKNKAQVTLSPELSRILEWGQKVREVVGKRLPLTYLVLDGHFGNHPAYQMARRLPLHLISKMRHNAALFLVPTAQQKQQHPHLKYGDPLDYAHLPCDRRVSCQEAEGVGTQIYQMRCRHKDFADLLNVVILVKTDLATGRVGHIVLFSSDLNLDAETLIDYYSLRFQIEFVFRDAKQHFGLDDFMVVTQTAVANAAGLSLLMVNLSSSLLSSLRPVFPEAGIQDLKSYYRGRRYVLETLKCLAFSPDAFVWQQVLEQVPLLGCIHPPSKAAKPVSSRPESGLSPGEKALAVAA